MATTTNFGWETPDDTDLVKDGAAAIRTALGGVDTSFVDLKGGTTGQILSKASNTDLDFVWAADAGSPTSYGFAAGKNAIINGAVNIWQRGTSFTATGYTADRWFLTNPGSNTVSRSTTAPDGFNYSLNWVTAGAFPVLATYVELPITGAKGNFTGDWVMSFYAKASTASTLSTDVAWADGSSRTNLVSVASQGNSLTTSWQRFTMPVDFDVSSPVGTNKAIEVNFYIASGGATINITGVQLEAGSSATQFQTATGSIQGELAACQRYYYRVTATQAYSDFGSGYNKTTTEGSFMIPFPVTMRTTPTALEQTGTASNYNILHASGGSPARSACSSVPSYQVATPTMGRVDFIVASGLTSGNGAIAGSNNNTSAYLGWSAEL